MYIDFLNESPLWYWYHSGGVIAGLVVTLIFGAIVFGQSSWNTGGILLKTILGSAFFSVMPLGLARLGFSMAIGNPELVGYLSVGGTAVALTVGLAYFTVKAFSKGSTSLAAVTPSGLTPTRHESIAERDRNLGVLLETHNKENKKPEMNKPETNVMESPVEIKRESPKVKYETNQGLDMTYVGGNKPTRIGWLTINSGDNAGSIFYLDEGSNTIGRNSSNTISVSDAYMSGQQCDIKVSDNKISLFDLGSRAGTKINERVIGGKTLNLGSSITFGDTKMKVIKIDSPEQFNSVTNMDQTMMDVQGKKAVVLVAVSGPDAGASFILREGNNKIGRNPNADVCLTDKSVSRSHAVIRCEDGVFTLYDVGSSTRTDLDGVRLSGTQLRGGEVITAGKTQFTFTAAA